MLDVLLCPRTVKTSIKHRGERCLEVRVWSIGRHCCRKLNVMTLTELIHTVNYTDSPPSPASCTSGYRGQCHIFWPLLFVTPHPRLVPGALCRLTTHMWTCVIDNGQRFSYVCEMSRQSPEQIHLLRELLSELTSHPYQFNTLLHCPAPPSLTGRLFSPSISGGYHPAEKVSIYYQNSVSFALRTLHFDCGF